MSDTNLPAEFWSALIKIEGTTSTTQSLVTALRDEIRGLTSRVENVETDVRDTASRLDRIEAERAQMVPEYKSVKDRVDVLEKWQATSTSSAGTALKIAGWVWAVIGSGVTAIAGWLIVSYAHGTPL